MATQLFSLATESRVQSSGDLSVSLLDFTEATDAAMDDAATVTNGADNMAVIQAGADSLAEAQTAIPAGDEVQAPAVLDAVAGPVEEAYRAMGLTPVAGKTYAGEDFKGGRQGRGREALRLAHENITRDAALGMKAVAEKVKNLITSGTGAFAHGHGTLKDCIAEVQSNAADANKAGLLKLLKAATTVLSTTEAEFHKAAQSLKDLSSKDSSTETHRNTTDQSKKARSLLSLQRAIVSDAVRVAKKLIKSQEDHSAQLNQYVGDFNTLVGHIKSAHTGEDVDGVIKSLKDQTTAIAGKTFGDKVGAAAGKVTGAASNAANWVKDKFSSKDKPAQM